MAAALLCTQCGAPLPQPTSDSVTLLTCGFCGTTNELETRRGHTEIRRAVKREIDERFGPRPPVRPPPTAHSVPYLPLAIGVGVMLALGVVVASILVGSRETPRVTVVPPRPPKPPVKPPEPPPQFIPPTRPDPVLGMALDEQGDVIVLRETTLSRLEHESLKPAWKVDFRFRSAGGMGVIIVPRGPRIAVVGGNEIAFLDAATGALTGRYLYRNGGILEHACGAGKSEVVVDVLGDGWMRFDSMTGKPSSGRESCRSREKLTCPAGQTCGWNTTHYTELYCTNALHVGAERYRDCETEDGTKRDVIAAFDAKGKKRWMVEGPDADDFIGLVNGKVLVGDGRYLNAYQASDGTLAWSKTGVSSTISDGTTIVIATDDGVERLTP